MHDVEKYFQMGVFEGYAHTHTFEKGVSLEEQESWLRDTAALCREAGIGYVVRRTEKDGEPGYEFGFAGMSDCVAFVHNVFGDLESPGGHGHTHRSNDPEYLDAFRAAAEMHLRELGIKYTCEMKDGAVRFEFDRFSDRIVLGALIAQGTIDASAQGLALAKAYQRVAGASLGQYFGARPGADLG